MVKKIPTFMAPIINKTLIKIVMTKLITRMIFTTDEGRKSNKIVLNSTRATKIIIMDIIDIKIPQTPEIIVPALKINYTSLKYLCYI